MNRTGSAWTISGGTAAGSNLFHSFSGFGIPTGQSAAFSGSAANVIARVTGGNVSVIDGQLSASGNLWLLNPAGITLNANASLNLGGSFHASSANYLKLADGGVFQAALSPTSSLTSAPPSAFGFLGPAGPVTVNGATLSVAPNQHLSLVGGTLTVQDAFLGTDGGNLALAATASAGEFDVTSSRWSGTGALAPMMVSGSTLVSVGSASASGVIALRGGAVSLSSTNLVADTITANAGRGISIEGGESVSIVGGNLFSGTITDATAGGVGISAPRVVIAGGALINTDTGYEPAHITRNTGTGGAITVSGGDVLITDATTFSARSVSRGTGGGISVNSTGALVVESFALLSTDSTRGGASGNMTLSGRDVALRDSGALRSTSDGRGTGGTIAVLAQDSVTVAGGSSVNIDTKGRGQGGGVIVAAGGIFDLQGKIFSGAQASVTGDAGSVTVNAGTLRIGDGGAISTQTIGTGRAGDIRVSAGRVDVGAGGVIESSTTGSGAGGSILLSANTIDLHHGGLVSASSASTGFAGSITLEAQESVTLAGGSAITTEALSADGGDVRITVRDLLHVVDSRITTSVNTSTGHGGNITIDPTFVVLDGGQIVAQAAQGAGGNISIQSSFFLAQGNWLVDASSQQGISGVVSISAPKTDLGSGMVILASNFLVAHRLSESCASRAGRASSSFIAAGRGGLPVLDLLSRARQPAEKSALRSPGCLKPEA